jgi:hypothetical protein
VTNEQLNDLLVAGVSNINDRCIAQLSQLRDTMRRYVDDTTKIMADFEDAKKNERNDAISKCMFAIKDCATVEEAVQKLGVILAENNGIATQGAGAGAVQP